MQTLPREETVAKTNKRTKIKAHFLALICQTQEKKHFRRKEEMVRGQAQARTDSGEEDRGAGLSPSEDKNRRHQRDQEETPVIAS